MTAETILTKEYLCNLFEYSKGSLYRKIRTANCVYEGEKAGFTRKDGYRQIKVNQKPYLEHQIVFIMHHGYKPSIIDHINGIKTDNRIENLRKASFDENAHNAKRKSTNTSGVKNVSYSKRHKSWMVRVQANKTRKLIGLFKDLELAELVAIEARNKYHREYANHG